MEHEVRATTKFVAVAPQKVRLMVDLVRGHGADDALRMLKFMPGSGSKPVAKVIRTAIANAEENFGLSRDDLVISRIFADEGPTRKWRRFGARGRWKPILKRSSHITVVLTERAS